MMEKFLNIALISLLFACGEKQNKIQKPQIKAPDSTVKILENHNQKTPEIPTKALKLKTVDCKDKGGNMENGFVTECLYKNYDLTEAYNDFRERNKDNEDGKYLEKKMPSGKHTAGFSDYPISVTYTYPKQHILDIEIFFPGGLTIINFNKEKDDVKVNITHSPD